MALIKQNNQASAASALGPAASSDDANLAHLLQIVANTAELPDCRRELGERGAAAAIQQAAGYGADGSHGAAMAGSGATQRQAALSGRAAEEALRLLRFDHWPH